MNWSWCVEIMMTSRPDIGWLAMHGYKCKLVDITREQAIERASKLPRDDDKRFTYRVRRYTPRVSCR